MHTAALEKPKDADLLQMDADWGDVCGAVREEARGYGGRLCPCLYEYGFKDFCWIFSIRLLLENQLV